MLGRRPKGAVYSAPKVRTKEWKDTEIVAYIQNKDGEYDEIEKVILSDPWADGYQECMNGVPIDAIQAENPYLRAGEKEERRRLRLKGWNDCARDMGLCDAVTVC